MVHPQQCRRCVSFPDNNSANENSYYGYDNDTADNPWQTTGIIEGDTTVTNVGEDETKCKCRTGKRHFNVLGSSDDCSSLSLSSKDYMAHHFHHHPQIRNTHCRYFPFSRRRLKRSTVRTIGITLGLLFLLLILQLYFGLVEKYLFEKNCCAEFQYPLDVPDFSGVINRFREVIEKERGISVLEFQPPPVNLNYSSVVFAQRANNNISAVGLLIIVKSASWNYKKRMAIRRTWAEPNYLKNHYIEKDLPTKVSFICGIPEDYDSENGEDPFAGEKQYEDIILAKFQDSYGNNTYKTLLLMRWALESVKSFKYLMIVDDDMYISPQNTVAFINNVSNIEVQTVISGYSGSPAYYLLSQLPADSNHSMDILGEVVALQDQPLIMGQVWVDSKPFRNFAGPGAKWSLRISDYPYNYYPPYVAGAATLIDSETVAKLYYGSLFTRHIWIDDVYIGIIAKKLGITLTHNELIDSSYRDPTSKLKHDFKDMLAVHGLKCPEQLVELWSTMEITSLTDCDNLPQLPNNRRPRAL